MTAPLRDRTGARPGLRVGPDEAPDTFRLVDYVGQGGEGELWLADEARSDGLTRHRWALKIMHARNLRHRDDVSPLDELTDRLQRYVRSKRETDQLARSVPGVVGATDAFQGGEPHPEGAEPQNRCLYVVSPWVDGSDLATWRRRTRPTFDGLCDVVDRLAAIVDGMATHAMNVVHRDISPGNVIVGDDGDVALIDFTFVRPPNTSAGTVAVRNGGYTAPEVYGCAGVDVMADRYSVGAVTYFLLTGQEPPRENVQDRCRDTLRRWGLPAPLADHVVTMLAVDPTSRPSSLRTWAHTLRGLGQQGVDGGGPVTAALAVDGSGSAVVVAAGHTGLATARLAAGLPRRLVADPDSPPGLCATAAATDGAGAPVVLAVDDAGVLWVHAAKGWTEGGAVRPVAGLAAVRTSTGGVTGFAVEPSEDRLTSVAVDLDGGVRLVRRHEYVSRVLAATTAADGSPVVAAVAAGGGLVCVEAVTTAVVSGADVAAAGVCLNVWGELFCIHVVDGPGNAGTVAYVEQFSGSWGRPVPVDVPGAAVDIACVGTREGVTIAVAGTAGLHLATLGEAGLSAWRRLTDRPARQVALAVGAAWRLQLIAVIDDEVVATAEGYGSWDPLRRL